MNSDNNNSFNKQLGLYIPYIASKHMRSYSTGNIYHDSNIEYKIKHFIKYYFSINYGSVNRVDIVKKSNPKGTFYSAFIHFNEWIVHDSTIAIQNQLNNNVKTTFSLYFPNNDGWHWILLKQHNAEKYNNPEFLLDVIKKQELQIKNMNNTIVELTNLTNNESLPRKKQKQF